MDVLNVAVGLMSLVLGGFSIWLALHFYEKARDAEVRTSSLLESIKTQAESLQKLTGRWMDRFTRHATEPKPADESLMALVSAMADLPTTILTTLRITPTDEPQELEPLRAELVAAHIGLYYYSGVANVAFQALLPSASEYDQTNPDHANVRRLVDSTATDFSYIAQVLNAADRSRVETSRLANLLTEALRDWQPHVRTSDAAFQFKDEPEGSAE